MERACKKCGMSKPLTHEFWGHTPSGALRGTCRACMALNTRLHHRNNPEMTKARRDARKLLEAQAGGVCTITELRLIRERQADRCAYCGVSLHGGGEKDHILPLSKGGTNHARNIVLACTTCNRDKSNKTVAEFLSWRRDRGLPIAARMIPGRAGKKVRFLNRPKDGPAPQAG